MKAGFVSLFGKPNAGKSTLLNALLEEKLAIVSPKAQTTRHRIKGILNGEGYQVVLSDTPGIIDPKYRLQEKMMEAVRSAMEDADLGLLVVDIQDDPKEWNDWFTTLQLQVPCIVVVNKIDKASADALEAAKTFFSAQPYCQAVIGVSALKKKGISELLQLIIDRMPEGSPYFDTDDLTDLPTKFFVGEQIREQIFHLFKEEIPYSTTVFVKEFKEKTTLIKIAADIIVQRESQKGILLGEGGSMIRRLGTESRKEIEKFLGRKVFLELQVRVKPKWRDNDQLLKEYGYL